LFDIWGAWGNIQGDYFGGRALLDGEILIVTTFDGGYNHCYVVDSAIRNQPYPNTGYCVESLLAPSLHNSNIMPVSAFFCHRLFSTLCKVCLSCELRSRLSTMVGVPVVLCDTLCCAVDNGGVSCAVCRSYCVIRHVVFCCSALTMVTPHIQFIIHHGGWKRLQGL
jgi:hypothetical protein